MKIFNRILPLFIVFIVVNACQKPSNTPEKKPLETKRATVHAPGGPGHGPGADTGDFVKFDFSTGKNNADNPDDLNWDNDWDIAFRKTTIIVNGGSSVGMDSEPERNGNAGAYITSGIFSDLAKVDTDSFKQDGNDGTAITTGSGNGWYNYNHQKHIITPIPGKIIVIKTRDGKYAKMEILSYYQGAPSPEALSMKSKSGYYTFNYVTGLK